MLPIPPKRRIPIRIHIQPRNPFRESQNQIQTTQQTRTRKDARPKEHVAERLLVAEPPGPAQLDERELAHLQHEQVAAQLLEDAPHDELVHAGRQEEGDERRRVLVDLHRRDRAVVDVPQEEVVHGAVPVAGVLVPRDCVMGISL